MITIAELINVFSDLKLANKRKLYKLLKDLVMSNDTERKDFYELLEELREDLIYDDSTNNG